MLGDTNLKLTAVVTNIMGLSAHDMLDALLQGETNPEVSAKLARGKLRKKREEEDQPKAPLSYQQAMALLESIPGVNQRIAQIFLAEVGTDMQHFPTAGHLARWRGICPGNHQSAGNQRRGTTRHPVIEGLVKPSLNLMSENDRPLHDNPSVAWSTLGALVTLETPGEAA